MIVQINGTAQTLGDVKTIAELVVALDLPAPTLLIEHNGLALRREEWSQRAVNDGDSVEILRIAAGG